MIFYDFYTFYTFIIFYFFHCIYGLQIIDPKKFRKTPSNARIFPKGFQGIDFWTSFLSIF